LIRHSGFVILVSPPPPATIIYVTHPPRPQLNSILPSALSAALALALYAITLGGTYIYDDVAIIQLDQRVQHPKLWGQFWTHDWWYNGSGELNGAIDNLYRPLISQSFGLQYWLHGDKPAWAFHLVNILLHAGVAALVAELARRLVSWRVGLIAGLLFACHPIHSEAVAGIVGRAELGCAIGVIGAMVLFVKRPVTIPRAWAIFAISVVAMLSKEQGLLLPFLLGALIPVRRALLGELDDREKKAMQVAFILLLFFTVGLINLRESVLKLKFEWDRGFLDPTIQPLIKSPPLDRWLIPIALIGRYFALLICPWKLSIDYGVDVIGPAIRRTDPYLLLGYAVAILCIALAIVAWRRRQWVVLYSLFALWLTYSAASNFVISGTIFAERLMYLPSAFVLILIAIAIARLPTRAQGLVVVTLLLLSSIRTWTYIEKWNDRDSFYEYSLRQRPQSVKIALLVSYVDYEENRLPDARRLLDDLKSRHPEYWEIWKRYGLIDEKAGDWDAAAADWKQAFYLRPDTASENRWGDAMAKADKLHAATRQTSRP
jgi:hypothetical protein